MKLLLPAASRFLTGKMMVLAVGNPMRSEDKGGGLGHDEIAHHTPHQAYPHHNYGAHFLHRGQLFCSRSEAACAFLMSKYVGYRYQWGRTFQIPAGVNHRSHQQLFDFEVRDAIFEYHPQQAPKEPRYWRMLHRLPPGERAQFRNLWMKNAAEHYFDRRRALMDLSMEHRNKELIVARNPEEFYNKVIRRFMREDKPDAPWLVPFLDDFLAEFRAIQGEVKDLVSSRGMKRGRILSHRRAA